MNRTLYFSGMQPSVEDLVFDQDSRDTSIKDRVRDFFTDGVLTGLNVSIVGGKIMLHEGIAYVSGERIEITEDTIVSETIQDGFVFLKFKPEESESESHFITGELFNTRMLDSFEIQLNSSSEPVIDAILLCEILNSNIIDMRSFIELKLSKPESTEPPNNLIVTTGFESDLNLTSTLAL